MSSSIEGPEHRPIPTSRYDLSTYWGRVRHCLEISDPRNLLVTPTQVRIAKQALSEYRHGYISEFAEELWEHKQVLDSTVHPDTGETIFLPFRMSCCVLSNLIVTAGMLTPNLTVGGTIFWQWANQSLNVAINTSNANKSHPLTTKQLLTNYAAAVSASCGVALGLNALVPRLKSLTPKTKLIMTRLVPFAAVVSAGIVNVFLMRSEELKKGITVVDPETKEPLGTSKVAATYAVGETAASRVINATPIMAIPPLILVKLQRGFLKGKGLGITTAVNLGLITVTSFAVLPFALAVFPQTERLHVSKLEDKFRELRNKSGKPVEFVEFNRGI
ncbi:Fsf1 protein [Saccharomycopsis crataegensis]|uniref:Sidoreflexin n=1 Tax=Saccharomycopsis crataegensis TaxID=43959 RepID=A0AAV5QLY2_9ASCO|nr:Fsf1 protein [Saccharomycopsis crataegensis]